MEEQLEQQNKIEADLHRVGQEVREQVGGVVTPEATERALVRQSLQPMITAPSTQTPQRGRAATDDAMLPTYMKDVTVDIKDRVERLVEDAFAHGVEHAAEEAQKSGPFVVDALHDALSDRFYEELKKRNLV
ncbi:MAG: hypothetical protein UX49_C0001G0044 [Candidatus Wolfebacteria bacterium GW2011_GWC2_46_275]|uniref:Uncharacterized protein n=2 Tax=Candidatus Wolfeibacteriota TaxID=1752735 RepID=A0A0G1WJG7_9BACT|nr:MAG: hypothetical protein UX70_C0001G0466 [Candidatus Wolfebacteria bacterium GW2011_GWB1_47_1]KKU37174.1 MAG: hypothetical protein UX49_C0001G0044 [Candidatus Wolfebacteria bacterium GW2011_GWC2_46_275]KKU42666.1 MAG: hypothetical protein UX58_C0001G0098 [Candidatus Wolfebacteria bacterium GW2011_GWB2_46_69]KKU54599.1 MAG: hypothetical protein UX76_C0001G0058 [Candidatus Wolfebacteria bacterium GW2011_GWC1_47_103]KKU59983.1 MAG: hypothetical protein UX83_C0001G0058 [Candidatus Wolfebacteria